MTVMLNTEIVHSDRLAAPLKVTHLQELEAESIFVIREVAAQFERPVLLFSGGKDSIILSHLARKAFWPARIPFPLLHIDTGHNFPETLSYRDWWMDEIGAKLIVRSVQDSIDQGRAVEEKGYNASRNMLQTVTLLDAIEELKVDAALGGARRDEEKARAKERFFSHRDEFGQWDPKNQRPELWNLFNGHKNIGEHFRVFPISNWTEMDVWQYILQEQIDLPSIYFTHQREVIERDGNLLADSDFLNKRPTEQPELRQVRFRTIGDMTCTGAVLSPANSLEEIIQEVAASRQTERGTRADDKRSEAAMEDRKKKAISREIISMSVTIDLAPEVEAEAYLQAKAEGVALEEYLPRLIQRALPLGQVPLRQGSREWIDLLRQAPPVAQIDPATGQAPAVTTREDLRREYLYEERS